MIIWGVKVMFRVKLPPIIFPDPCQTYRFRVEDKLLLTLGWGSLELILIEYYALVLLRVFWGFNINWYLIQGKHHGTHVGGAWRRIICFTNQVIIAALPFSRGETRLNVGDKLLRPQPILSLCHPGYHLLAVLRFLFLLLDGSLSLWLLYVSRIWAVSIARVWVLRGWHQDFHGWLLLRIAFLLYYHIPAWGVHFSSRRKCIITIKSVRARIFGKEKHSWGRVLHQILVLGQVHPPSSSPQLPSRWG